MTNTIRMFQVIEDFKRVSGSQLLRSGEMASYFKEEYETGLRFVVENIAKEGSGAVYIDHSRQNTILFTEDEIEILRGKFIIEERFK